FQRVGREHGAHLGVARLVPHDARDRPQLSEEAGAVTETARASWPGSAQDQQFTPSQCHSIWPYRPGTTGKPSASTWTRSRYGFASTRSRSTARCCGNSCLRIELAGAVSPFIFPDRKPKACQGRSATLHCLASSLPGRCCGRRGDAHAAYPLRARVRRFAAPCCETQRFDSCVSSPPDDTVGPSFPRS